MAQLLFPVSSPWKPRVRRVLAAGLQLGIGVALLAALVGWLGPDWGEVRRRLEVDPFWFTASLLASAAAATIGALRWRLLNEHLSDSRLPFTAYFHYMVLTRLIGQFSSMLLMDLVGRGVGLRSAGAEQGLGQLVTPVVLERVADVLFPCCALAWAVWWHRAPAAGAGWAVSWSVTLVLATGVVGVLIRPSARVVLWAHARVSRWRGRSFAPPEIVLPRKMAAAVTLLGLGRYLAVLGQFTGIALAVGAVKEAEVVAVAFPVSQLSAILAITPGGLGVQDAGWAGALAWQSVDETSIAMFLLAVHAGVIVNFGLLTVLSLPFAGRRAREVP